MSTFESENHAPAAEQAAPRAITRDEAREVFGRTMGLVAMTVGVCALGAWAGKEMSFGWSIAFWIAGFAALIGLNFARKKSHTMQITLLFAVGALLGLAIGPTVQAYAEAFGAVVVAQAAGLTALFIALFGTVGYLTKRDLAPLARVAFFALLGLIVFGIVMLFVSIPAGYLIYCILGLVIFGVFTMYDFQRLRVAHPDDAVLIAASIFVDVLNVFLLLLQLLGLSRD
jgi:modulator of FtsH protease